MGTRSVVESYFRRLAEHQGWDEYLADDVVFSMLTVPGKTAAGKAACLEATRRFYASFEQLTVRQLVVDDDRAAALVRYTVRPPNGAATFESDVAEFFTVRDDRIRTFTICFDTAPYPKPQSAPAATPRA